jgi:hypothetical protein
MFLTLLLYSQIGLREAWMDPFAFDDFCADFYANLQGDEFRRFVHLSRNRTVNVGFASMLFGHCWIHRVQRW